MKPGKATAASVSLLSLETEVSEDKILQHVGDESIHTSGYEKEQIAEALKSFADHKNDGNVHVSKEQIEDWTGKETPSGAQDKVNKVKSLLQKHENDSNVHVTVKEKEKLHDKYTRAEINALLSSIVSSINWVEEVETYDQISIVHPNPSVRDTCTVLDTGISYTFNGKQWVVSFVSFLPVATPVEDGRMSKEDKQKLDDIEQGANNYQHPDDEYSRHVTDSQINSWEHKADDVEATTINRGLMSPTDKKKLNSVEYNANYYEHPSKHHYSMIETDDTHQFISKDEIEYFNTKVDPDELQSAIEDAIDEANRYVNNVISNLSNTTPELYNLLMTIRKELSSDTISILLRDISGKLDTESFNNHVNDEYIHVTPEMVKKINTLLADPKIDWNETNPNSPKYIVNKPEALPANGGNADTVGGLSAAALLSNRKAATVTIGTLRANCLTRSVDYICDGKNDAEVIQKAFNMISSFGGTILFREGTYLVDSSLTLHGNNITIDSCNATIEKTFSDGTLLNVSGDNCVIKNLSFKYGSYPNNNNTFINIKGSNNIIRDNHFLNGSAVILGSGSNNIISHNVIDNPFYGISVMPEKGNANYNSVNDNSIIGGQYGIVIKGTSWSILHNFIKDNKILNCGVGLWLTSSVPINDKVSGCGITGNHVLRGFGDDSSYGTNQKDILVEYGFKNIISGNTLKKIEIRGSKNQVVNNINV